MSAAKLFIPYIILVSILSLSCGEKYKRKYYDNGFLLSEVVLKNGVAEGIEKGYYKSGKRKWEVNYKDGLKHGIYQSYFENDTLEIRAEFRNDTLFKFFEQHFEDGKYKSQAFFNEDSEIGNLNSFNELGEMIETDQHLTFLVHGNPILNERYYVEIEVSGISNGIVDGYVSQLDKGGEEVNREKLLIENLRGKFSFVPMKKENYTFSGYVFVKNVNNNLNRYDFNQEFGME